MERYPGILSIFPVDITSSDFHIRPPLMDQKHSTVQIDIIHTDTYGLPVNNGSKGSPSVYDHKTEMKLLSKFKNIPTLQYKKWLTEQ